MRFWRVSYTIKIRNNLWNRPVDRAETHSVSGAEGLRFKSRAGQSDTVLATARHRCDIPSKGAVFGRNAEMGLTSSLHASASIQRVSSKI